MSGLLKIIGSKPAPAQVAGVRIQSSIAGLAIPIVYGTARVSGNLIDYTDWASSGQSGKRGKQLSKMGGDANNYKAAIVEALCEGPIQGIGMVWADKDNPADFGGTYVANYGWSLFTGTATQAAWSYMTTHHAERAVPYQYTVYAVNPSLSLPGDSTPHYTWEIIGLQRFGAALSAAAAHALSGGSSAQFNTSLTQADGYFNGGIIEFTSGTLSGYIGQVTAYVHSSGNVTVATPFPAAPASGDTFTIYPNGDCLPNAIITDALTDVNHGLELPSSMLGDWTSFAAYCQAVGLFLSPVFDQAQDGGSQLQEIFAIANCAPFWSDGVLKVVPYGDTAVTGNGVTWTPDSTPVYALSDDDFLETPPVTMQRVPSAQAYNRVTVEYEDRAFQYNTQTQEAKDDAAIDAAGRVLAMPQLSFHEIKIASVARTVAQLALQRVLWVRNTYRFTLPLSFALLEPMDLVTLTDAGLGLTAYPVRLTSVTWTTDDTLECEAEDWPFGTATAALYGAGVSGGYVPDANVAPGPTADPLIVEAPVGVATSPLDLLINVAGGEFWGGCDVYVSQDDATFAKVGQIINRAVYGVLGTGGVPSTGSNYPTVDSATTVPVDLTMSEGAMVSQPDAAFAQLLPLLYVDGEWMCYETATLTATYEYNLTHLYRALYGTARAAHAAGTPFGVIDLSDRGGTFRLPWPTGQPGQALYFKFPAFNVYGRSAEDVSTVASYGVTINQGSVTVFDATAQGTVRVDPTTGDWTANVDGPGSVQSYSAAWSTSAMPSDATAAASANIYNGRTVVIAGSTPLTGGQPIYIAIVPWTGAGATGAQLPSIHLVGNNQVMGPSLNARITATTSTTATITYTYVGSIEVSIDGAVFAAPGAASPWVVTLDGDAHTYTFLAVENGQTVTQTVNVPSAPRSLSITSRAASNAGATGPPFNRLVVAFTTTNMPTGVTYDVSYQNDMGGSDESSGNTSSPVTFNSVTFGASVTPGSGTVTISAISNGTVVATAKASGLYTY